MPKKTRPERFSLSSAQSPGKLGVMFTLDDLLRMPISDLRATIAAGFPIDPEALAGMEYRGTSLGLPAIVDKLAWKTFQKTFYRDPATGKIRGWNVRVEQHGIGASSVPLRKHGDPFTFGHYRVTSLENTNPPWPVGKGLLLDYSQAGNPRLDPTNRVRDPIFALEPGNVDLLLGWMYLDLGLSKVPTPSFFALERERPITFVPKLA